MKTSRFLFVALSSLLLYSCGGGGGSIQISPPAPTVRNEWTWVKGSNLSGQQNVSGGTGTTSAADTPGGREGMATSTDARGNLWLFGGAVSNVGNQGLGTNRLNDLWEYSGGTWTWVTGGVVYDETGIYGIEGAPDASNRPGARESAISWIDSTGNVWLFGGYGMDSQGSTGLLNDLWRYSAGEWTWMSGSDLVNQGGVYGTKGTPASGNVPGRRRGGVGWIDASGNLWLFGGFVSDQQNFAAALNDLWKYSSGQWTWMGGSDTVDQDGVYGTEGTPSPGNIPGARGGVVSWTDGSGHVWIFGGTVISSNFYAYYNDLWEYNGGQWAWMGGSNTPSARGVYGTKGTPAAGNTPGARSSPAACTDSTGNMWLFGGYGIDSSGNYGLLNDLWKFAGGQWTWVGGSNGINDGAVYGTQGTAAAGNFPGARGGASTWRDSSGDLWLFGGSGYDSTGNEGDLNDLWLYQP